MSNQLYASSIFSSNTAVSASNRIFQLWGVSNASVSLGLSSNLGIGITNPTFSLEVVKDSNPGIVVGTSNGAGGRVAFGNTFHGVGRGLNISTATNANDVNLYTSGSGGSVVICTGATTTERFRITNTGAIGIGTTSPSVMLDVNGTINSTDIQGARITSLSNLGLFGSNAGAFGSNLAISTSNALYPSAIFGSNAGVFGSNLAITSSNFLYPSLSNTSNMALFGSNAGRFGSNTAVWASNAGAFGSNTSVWASNNIPNTSGVTNTAVWASNAGAFGSNTSVLTSNNAFGSSNILFPVSSFGSNTSVWASNASTFGSNTSVWSSNLLNNFNLASLTASNIRASTNLYASDSWLSNRTRMFYGDAFTGKTYPCEMINTYISSNSSVQLSLKVSNSNGIDIGFNDCTAHGAIRAGIDASGMYMSLGCSNYYGWVADDLVIRHGGNVGIRTSNPAYTLDVKGNCRLNNAFIGDVGWGATLAGFSHSNMISTVGYALLQANTGQTLINCPTSQTINFRVNNADTMIMNANSLGLSSTNVIEFGKGVAGKDASAGKIGYQTFTSGALDIVGAGTTSGSRTVKLWDNVNIPGSLSVGGSTFKGIFCGSASIPGSGGSSYITQTITHNWNLSGTQTLSFSQLDTVSPVVPDSHAFKVTARNANTFDLVITRVDNLDGSPWTRSFTLLYTIILT